MAREFEDSASRRLLLREVFFRLQKRLVGARSSLMRNRCGLMQEADRWWVQYGVLWTALA